MKLGKAIARVLVPLLLMSVCGFNVQQKTADLIVYGKIYTSDASGSFAEAMAIKNGRYVYVGDKEGAQAYLGPRTDVAEAVFVMPSGVETHSHILLEEALKQGLFLEKYNENGSVKTTDQILDDILQYRNAHPELTAIYAFGLDDAHLDRLGKIPYRTVIDAVISDIPVFIGGRSLHSGFCNTLCLEKAGVFTGTAPVNTVYRDKNGKAMGVLTDEACVYVRNAVFGGVGHYDVAIQNAQALLHRLGYTMLLDPWSNFDGTADMSEALLAADRENTLQTVVFTSYCIAGYQSDSVDELIQKAAENHRKYTSRHTEQKYIKLFLDGLEEVETAYMLEPYSDGTYGEPIWNDGALNDAVAKANRAGLLVHAHAYGDASARQAVNAFENSNIAGNRKYRNSLAHAPYVADEDLERIAELDIGVAGSGNWALGLKGDPTKSSYYKMLGTERAAAYYMVDAYVEYGIKAGISTDLSCLYDEPLDVFDYMGILTTGVDYREKHPARAKRDTWASVEDAIRMITVNGAWSLDADRERGSIEVGKYADFICATGDPFTIPLKEIHTIQVDCTYFEGKRVFSSEQ